MDRRDLELRLIQDLLAAPGSPPGWQEFLLHLADAVGGSCANFISHNLLSSAADIAVTVRTDPEALRLYREHWFRFDPWAYSRERHLLRTGSVVLGHQLIARRDMLNSTFYNEFGRQNDVGQCVVGMIDVSDHGMSCVSINASAQRRSFDAEDAALLTALMPHLRRALQIHTRLAGAELMAANAMAVLDRLPHGVLLLSAKGAVLAANRAAEAILRSGNGLMLDRGELRASTPDLTNRVRALLRVAVEIGEGTRSTGNTGILLSRPSGLRPLSLIAAPLPADRPPTVSNVAVVVLFVTDPDRGVVADSALLRSMFDLTVAEAELVKCLLSGLTLEEAAVQLGLQIDTLRKRVKVIFQKTNTHRQADLMRLLVTSLSAS